MGLSRERLFERRRRSITFGVNKNGTVNRKAGGLVGEICKSGADAWDNIMQSWRMQLPTTLKSDYGYKISQSPDIWHARRTTCTT